MGMGRELGLVAVLGLGLVGCDEVRPGCVLWRPADGLSQVPTAAGRYDVQIRDQGANRGIRLVVPSTYTGDEPRPLMLLFHGGGSNARTFELNAKELLDIADKEELIVAVPDGFPGGQNNGWAAAHCCEPALQCGVDDVSFAERLVDRLGESLNIDRDRVYGTGFSNGGMMLHRAAAERPDLFAAVAPSGATAGGEPVVGEPSVAPDPEAPVPIMLVHGTDDPNVPIEGGEAPEKHDRSDMSFEETTLLWVEANGCDPTPEVTTEPSGNRQATINTFTNCTDGADVRSVVVGGLEHKWPKTKNTGGWDGSRAIADFLLSHSK